MQLNSKSHGNIGTINMDENNEIGGACWNTHVNGTISSGNRVTSEILAHKNIFRRDIYGT